MRISLTPGSWSPSALWTETPLVLNGSFTSDKSPLIDRQRNTQLLRKLLLCNFCVSPRKEYWMIYPEKSGTIMWFCFCCIDVYMLTVAFIDLATVYRLSFALHQMSFCVWVSDHLFKTTFKDGKQSQDEGEISVCLGKGWHPKWESSIQFKVLMLQMSKTKEKENTRVWEKEKEQLKRKEFVKVQNATQTEDSSFTCTQQNYFSCLKHKFLGSASHSGSLSWSQKGGPRHFLTKHACI